MRRVRRVELIGGLVGAALVAGGGAVALASPAWAAGSGYLPPSTFTVGNVPGGFSQVVTTQTLTTAGGSLSGTIKGATIAMSVPGGALPADTQVVIYAPTDLQQVSGAVAGISIVFLNASTGQPLTGTLGKAASVTITDSSIKSGDIVQEWNGSTYAPYSDASVTSGSATITFTSDPSFVVTPSTLSPASVPQATTPTTGVPVLGEGLLAGLLVGAGATGVVLVLRRRSNSPA